jgi:hypothetical protein
MRTHVTSSSATGIALLLIAAIALSACGDCTLVKKNLPPGVSLRQVVLRGTLASNDQATVLVDGLPATISGATWSRTMDVTSSPQVFTVTLYTNGLPVSERTLTVQ